MYIIVTLNTCVHLSVESFCKGDIKPAKGGLMIEPMNFKQRGACTNITTFTEDNKSTKADTTLVSMDAHKRPRQKAKKKVSSESKVKLPACGPPKQESTIQHITVKPANPNKIYFNANKRVGDALHIMPIKPAEPKTKPKAPLQPQIKASKLDPLESCIMRKKTFIIPPSLSPSNSGNYQNKMTRFDNYILQGIPVPTSNKGPLSTKPKGAGIDPSGAPIHIFRPKTRSSTRKHVTTPLNYSRQQRPPANLNQRLPRVTTPADLLNGTSNDNFLVNMLNNLG